MGHDITSYKAKLPNQELESVEISYIRFAMWNSVGIYLFYESLNAQQYNAGCSGSGANETYTLEILKKQKKNLII